MTPDCSLKVAGLVPLSTVDKPDALTATVFTQGCPWRCPYCHNSHLLGSAPPGDAATDRWTWERVMTFLGTRRGLLDGVAFSGGEPTIHAGLVAAMRDVRDGGFAAYLHTAGPSPDVLALALPLVQWVGFDVKAPFDEYQRVTRVADSGSRARESLRLLVGSGVPFEVRTTVHSDQLDLPALERLADDLAAEGVGSWVLQTCRTQGTSPRIPPNSTSLDCLDSLRERIPAVSLR
ncbi:MAG: anaerobic ribonucleoside-triphosphate reductase activating protein [Coriobacteriia bacterium]